MFGILRTYVLREIVIPAVMAALSLTFIILLMARAPWDSSERLLFTLLRFLFREDAPRAEILSIFGSIIPGLVVFIVPMALLVGIIIGIGRMTMDLEIRAMQSGGVNIFQIFYPIVLAGLLVSIFIGIANYSTLPKLMMGATQKGAKLLVGEVTKLEPGRVYPSLFKKGSGMSLYFDSLDPQDSAMKGVTVVLEPKALATDEENAKARKEHDSKKKKLKKQLAAGEITKAEFSAAADKLDLERKPGEAPMLVLAERAKFDLDESGPSVVLNLNGGSIHMLDSKGAPGEPKPTPAGVATQSADEGTTPTDGREYAIIRYESLTKTEPLPGMQSVRKPDLSTIPELRALSVDKSVDKKIRAQAKAAVLERISMSFQALIFALVGLPLAIYVRPSGKSVSMLLAAGLILTYHLLIRSGSSMVENGKSLGLFMVFMPNLLFACAAVLLWRKAARK